jgi:hypothetical protein
MLGLKYWILISIVYVKHWNKQQQKLLQFCKVDKLRLDNSCVYVYFMSNHFRSVLAHMLQLMTSGCTLCQTTCGSNTEQCWQLEGHKLFYQFMELNVLKTRGIVYLPIIIKLTVCNYNNIGLVWFPKKYPVYEAKCHVHKSFYYKIRFTWSTDNLQQIDKIQISFHKVDLVVFIIS